MKLNENFNQQEFIKWIEEFLPNFNLNLQKVEISNNFTGVKNITTLGEYNANTRIYIIETDIDPIRRKLTLAKDSFCLLKNYGSPNALIAYHSEQSTQWRLSLLTSTPTWSDNKIITKLSNPKRQSFALGSKAKINTPTKFLIKKGTIIDFLDLKSRFSIEVVNKDFYKDISQAFTKLVGGIIVNGKSKQTYESVLKLPSVAEKSQTNFEFAVRLIGRIVFCWFLREKHSSAGHSLMPRDLLSLDAVGKTQDYYHRILEPIFFEILNKPIRSRKENYTDELFSAIPYLNGGLFSPHEDDYFSYNESRQTSFHNTLTIPDDWFKSFFEVLETYNFTIDENSSFDEELSIDPEMLGRIFENLLAEINPDTGETARKSTGSYYTPRIIVDYMVDESIYLYLKEKTGINEEKIRSLISYDLDDDLENSLTEEDKDKITKNLSVVKILDPACGSGAFPIGALQKIVFILQQVDPNAKKMYEMDIKQISPEYRRFVQREYENGNFDYLRKLRIIRDCIYGVDIQPIATEISRLRCFLTLVVEQKIDDTLENRGIQPLPNLDFKFVTANSLIGLPKIDNTQPSMFDDYEKIDELKSIRDQYFNASGLEREQLKTEFVTQQKRLVDELINKHGFMGVAKAELTQQLTNWEPFTHKPTPWFDMEWMFGIKEGFDIVIANPPYLGEKGHKSTFDDLRKSSLGLRFNKGKMDIFYYFFHLGLDNLKQRGLLSFITTNYYPTADGAIKLRKDFYERTNVVELINFNEYKIFESALGQHNMITFLQKDTPKCQFLTSQTFVNKNGGPDTVELGNILKHVSPKGVYNNTPRIKLFDGDNLYLRFASSESKVDNLLAKLVSKGIHLKEYAITNEGIHTGLDTISEKDVQKYGSDKLTKGEGVFVLPKGIFRFSHLRPWYKGSDIKHYIANTNNSYEVLYYENNTVPDEEEIKHLSKYTQLLEKRVAIKRARRPWYQLNWPRKKTIFEGQKIVNPYRSSENFFALVDVPWYASADVFFTQTKDPKVLSNEVLTAILNSKLVLFWLINRGKRKGNILEIKSIPIGQIPIVLPNDIEKNKLNTLINNILRTKKNNIEADISIFEFDINQIVYNLYELTEDEIKIVEGKNE